MKLAIVGVFLLAAVAQAAVLEQVKQELIEACAVKIDEKFRDDKELIPETIDKLVELIDPKNSVQRHASYGLKNTKELVISEETLEKEIDMSVAKKECATLEERVADFLVATKECHWQSLSGNKSALLRAASSKPGAIRSIRATTVCSKLNRQK